MGRGGGFLSLDSVGSIRIIQSIFAIHLCHPWHKLFTSSDLEQGENCMLTRDEAKTILFPVAEDCLIPALQAGLELYLRTPPDVLGPLKVRTRAGILNDHIVDQAEMLATSVPGVKVDKGCGFTAIICGDAAVRIKKVDSDGRHSNYSTKQQMNWCHQKKLFDEGLLTNITFGYRMDDIWRSVTQASFVCWSGRYKQWEVPIVDSLHEYLPVIAAEEKQVRRSRVRPKVIANKEAKRG